MIFQKGQKVRVIDAIGNGVIKNGDIGVVEQHREEGGIVRVVFPGYVERSWFAKRFEPVAKAPKAAPAKVPGVFNPGDKVVVVRAAERVLMRLGSIHTVVGQHLQVDSINVHPGGEGWYKDRFEHYVEPAKAKPEPRKLEVGCRVACIDASKSDFLVLKTRYVVEKIYANGYVRLVGIKASYHPRRFKVVAKAPAPKAAAPAKPWVPSVGDKVYVVGQDKWHAAEVMDKFINDGVVKTITEVRKYADPVQLRLDNNFVYAQTSLSLSKPANVVKPPPPPPVVKADLSTIRDRLFAKGGSSICSFAFVTNEGVEDLSHYNAPCHAALGYGGRGAYQALIYCLRREAKKMKNHEEAHKAYCNYIISQSPWKAAFITQDIEEAYTKDIFMNVEVNRFVMAGACVALRVGSEKAGRAEMFKLFADNGHNPHTCWLLSCAFKSNGGDTYVYAEWGGGHDVIDSYRSFDETIKFFKQGYHTAKGLTKEPWSTDHGGYVIAEAVAKASGESIREWLDKNTQKETIGEGFYKAVKTTKQSLFDVATLIDNLLKEQA